MNVRTWSGSRHGWLAGVLLMLFAMAAWAQSPAPMSPRTDLRLRGGVTAMLPLPDGSVIVGGYFVEINGMPRVGLARITVTGGIDPDWKPDIAGTVSALARDASGRIYVGGSFSAAGGLSRKNLVRVFPTGVVDATWQPEPDSAVYALAVDPVSQDVFAGGAFTSIGGQSRARLALLRGDTGAAVTSFNMPANADVRSLLSVQGPAGQRHVYVGGRFTTINGVARNYVARLRLQGSSTTLTAWNPYLDATGVYDEVTPGVYAMAEVEPDRVVLGGVFRKARGLDRRAVVMVFQDEEGLVIPTWNPRPHMEPVDAESQVNALQVGSDGTVYLGGSFTAAGTGDLTRTHGNIARVLPGSGSTDPDWTPRIAGTVYALGISSGSWRLHVGGDFAHAAGEPRASVAIFNGDGSLSTHTAHAGGIPGLVLAIAPHPDGGTVVGGVFHLVNGVAVRENVLRLQPDGNLHPTWHPRVNDYVHQVHVAANGDTYIAGAFWQVNGTRRYRLAKLLPDGSLDPEWVLEPRGDDGPYVTAFAPAGNGMLYIGGEFTTLRTGLGGTPVARTNLARVFTSGQGAVDLNFNVPVDSPGQRASVQAIATSTVGEVYVGGAFSRVAGQSRFNIARISANGQLDGGWNFPADGSVRRLELGVDGWLYASGAFDQIGGHMRRGIARLNPGGDGQADPAWDMGIANGSVEDFTFSADGSLYVAGSFTSVGGYERTMLARFLPSGIVDPAWNPLLDELDIIDAIRASGNAIVVGGYFASIGGQPRLALARLPADTDRIFSDGFEP